MLIENLIRFARPLLHGGMPPRKILEIISDVTEASVRNFYRHVFVVELPQPGDGKEPVALPLQVFGDVQVDKKGKEQFYPDERALAVPFTLSKGGNPLYPQGTYGVPVYPIWLRRQEKDGTWTGQAASPELAREFLTGRLERTPGLRLDQKTVAKTAEVLHDAVQQARLPAEEKALGLVVLVQAGAESSPYKYRPDPEELNIGESALHPGQVIVPDFARILEAIWSAKIEEGADKGSRSGRCSICREEGQLVSPYAKAWPWALPEWKCPFPMAGDESLWIEGVALCRECSQALTLGAKVFEMLTCPVHNEIVREVFSPPDDRKAREKETQPKVTTRIYGSAYILPMDDQMLDDPELRDYYCSELVAMMERKEPDAVPAQHHLSTVVGFDLFLSEEVDEKDLRVTLVYFHGDPGRGDVHVRAIFEEVRPATLHLLRNIARRTAETGKEVYRHGGGDEGTAAALHARYEMVPYILARAYGGSYLWDCLRSAYHRQPLGTRRFVRNAARRMQSLTHQLSDNHFRLLEEVAFFLSFLDFLAQYHLAFGLVKQGQRSVAMAMRPWKELLTTFAEAPVEELRFESPEELGFACGMLLRQFGRWYYGKTEKDYLQHRVMTFGTDLSPDAVWRRGLAKVFDVAARTGVHISDDFRRRVGVALVEFDRMQEEVKRSRDAFMAAFWAGYALSGRSAEEGETLTNESVESEEVSN